MRVVQNNTPPYALRASHLGKQHTAQQEVAFSALDARASVQNHQPFRVTGDMLRQNPALAQQRIAQRLKSIEPQVAQIAGKIARSTDPQLTRAKTALVQTMLADPQLGKKVADGNPLYTAFAAAGLLGAAGVAMAGKLQDKTTDRRGFLKTVAGGAAALAAMTVATPKAKAGGGGEYWEPFNPISPQNLFGAINVGGIDADQSGYLDLLETWTAYERAPQTNNGKIMLNLTLAMLFELYLPKQYAHRISRDHPDRNPYVGIFLHDPSYPFPYDDMMYLTRRTAPTTMVNLTDFSEPY